MESAEPASPCSRFVVKESDVEDAPGACNSLPENGESEHPAAADGPGPLAPNLILAEDNGSWRSEVTDRVNRYRARRRPRAPRYPSLTLKFESPEPRASRFAASDSSPSPTCRALAMDRVQEAETSSAASPPLPVTPVPAETGKVLEFPRSLTLPSSPLDELAEPVLDCPRILEVPEVTPPPPALGGILIEPAEDKIEEKRPGFEIPLQAARMSRRLAAAAVDGLIVLAALVLFAYIFFRVTAVIPPLPLTFEAVLALSGVLWAGYQYSALVFTGTTPGLKLAKLHLNRFDGNAVPHRLRCWRVLASVLSAVSLGLGYAWCFLDEDQLCWHDRITRTYMAPSNQDLREGTILNTCPPGAAK
jgi:uncharacterized RDD family membrane protein YckC